LLSGFVWLTRVKVRLRIRGVAQALLQLKL